MKKLVKGLAAVALAGAAAVTVTSCGAKTADKATKLFFGVQQTTDPTTIATENILKALQNDLNFTYEMQQVNSRDSVANLNTFKEKLNQGYNAIISMADLNAEEAEEVIETCADNGAYYVGYKIDCANTKKSTTVMESDYFLGSISDGELDWAYRAEHIFDALKASTDRKIVLASFSSQYFPQATNALTKFKSLVETWNAENPNDAFTYGTWADGSDTWTCKFSPLDDANAQKIKEQNVDAIVGMNSIAKYTLPKIDSNIHLYNVGYDATYDERFGEDKQLRLQGATPAEHVILPLMRVINAINGADPIPLDDKIVVGEYVYMSKAAELVNLKKTFINFTDDHSFNTAFFSVEDAKKLIGAKDEKVRDLVATWTTDYVVNRK